MDTTEALCNRATFMGNAGNGIIPISRVSSGVALVDSVIWISWWVEHSSNMEKQLMSDPLCPLCGNPPLDQPPEEQHYSTDGLRIYICNRCPKSYFGNERDIKPVVVVEKKRVVRKRKPKIDNNPKLTIAR